MSVMRDPVALAYSGRVSEAHEAAIEQAAEDDSFTVAQALEALAVLGAQHGVRSSSLTDERLLQAATSSEPSLVRRAFDAAAALGTGVLEAVAVERLKQADATWDVLRYAAECPTLETGRALAAGWGSLASRLRDQALLTSRAMPVANREENDAWGERVLAHVDDPSEDVRSAAFEALKVWQPAKGAVACSQALEDEAASVRTAAAQALALLELELLVERAAELDGLHFEAAQAVPAGAKDALAEALERRK